MATSSKTALRKALISTTLKMKRRSLRSRKRPLRDSASSARKYSVIRLKKCRSDSV